MKSENEVLLPLIRVSWCSINLWISAAVTKQHQKTTNLRSPNVSCLTSTWKVGSSPQLVLQDLYICRHLWNLMKQNNIGAPDAENGAAPAETFKESKLGKLRGNIGNTAIVELQPTVPFSQHYLCQGNLRILGMLIPSFIENPYNGYITLPIGFMTLPC